MMTRHSQGHQSQLDPPAGQEPRRNAARRHADDEHHKHRPDADLVQPEHIFAEQRDVVLGERSQHPEKGDAQCRP